MLRLVTALPLLANAVLAAPGRHHHSHELFHEALARRHAEPAAEPEVMPLGDTLSPEPAVSVAEQDADVTVEVAPTEPTTDDKELVFQPRDSDDPDANLTGRATTYQNGAYFTNWGVYDSYFPASLPVTSLTHVYYAFANIESDGTVVSSDTYADEQMTYSGDDTSESGTNVYGAVKQFFLLKQSNRNLKTLISIGGSSYSSMFPSVASTAAGRKQFALTAIRLMINWGFDGLDIDWEFPASATEAANYVLLLQQIRALMTQYSTNHSLGYSFLLTVATSAGSANYDIMNLSGMNTYLDHWNLMAYDYAGTWSTYSGDQCNLYASPANPNSTPINTNDVLSDYIAAGVPASKIALGLPLYGRYFSNTAGLGKTFSGGGTYDFNILPKSGSTVTTNANTMAAWSYDSSTKELVSYDNVASTNWKATYIGTKGMAGAFFWEASGDKTGTNSLMKVMGKKVGTLDTSQNNLNYPTSIYDNIKNQMA